jgi:hypothetical protein
MAIPDYETVMLPVLKIAGDGQEHRIRDVIEQLARDSALTDEERRQPGAAPAAALAAEGMDARWPFTQVRFVHGDGACHLIPNPWGDRA